MTQSNQEFLKKKSAYDYYDKRNKKKRESYIS